MSIKSVGERWEQGIKHDPRSSALFRRIKKLDEDNGDCFDFKYGGDGDNGEHLMYILDIIYEEDDRKDK